MTLTDLDKLETAFGIRLPDEYRQWASQLPKPGEETESWQHAFNNVDHLIEENRCLRSSGWSGLTWHPYLLCIGEFEGNHFFIDLHHQADVFSAQHDGEPFYDPDDYSQCRVASLEEFCGQNFSIDASASRDSSEDIAYRQNIEALVAEKDTKGQVICRKRACRP